MYICTLRHTPCLWTENTRVESVCHSPSYDVEFALEYACADVAARYVHARHGAPLAGAHVVTLDRAQVRRTVVAAADEYRVVDDRNTCP